MLLDKTGECCRFEVGDHRQPHPAGRPPTLLDRHEYQRRTAASQLAASAQPCLRTADPRVIDLHVAMQRFASRIDHCASKLVQQHPRRFVASQTKLPLQQERRHAPLVGHRQIGRPEPDGQRCLCVVENRAGGQRYLVPARRALPAIVARSRDTRGDGGIEGRQSHPASGRQPGTPDRLPRWRTDAETRSYSSETKGAPRRYTTYGGLLKQPDKHKLPSLAPYRVRCWRSWANAAALWLTSDFRSPASARVQPKGG